MIHEPFCNESCVLNFYKSSLRVIRMAKYNHSESFVSFKLPLWWLLSYLTMTV